MRRNLLFAFIGLLLCVSCARPETDSEIIAMQGLLNRVVPDYADKFKFYAEKNNISPVYEKSTDINGQAVFTDIKNGVYLVVGEDFSNGKVNPFLVELPSRDENGKLIKGAKIVQQAEVMIIERLGKYKETWNAGLHFKVPVFYRVVKKVSLKEQVADFAPQPVITKDNVTITVLSRLRSFNRSLAEAAADLGASGSCGLGAAFSRNEKSIAIILSF